MNKRILSFLLTLVMIVTMLPVTVLAAEGENVSISISYDGKFVTDNNKSAVAHVAVPIKKLKNINLDTYGLGDYKYDANGDGTPEITALHLYIYTHEKVLGKNWSDVSVSGGPGSIFFESGLFGFEDCNLMYFYNGIYPEVDGWGVTADQLVLRNGDFLDVAGYTSWAFYGDSATGFHYFADDNQKFTHDYSTKQNQELEFQLVRSYSAMGAEASTYEEGGYQVFYGKTIGKQEGSVTTDKNGKGRVTFSEAGTWYLWCDGGYGAENKKDIVSSPASAKVTVKVKEESVPQDTQKTRGILDATMAKLAATVTAPTFGTNAGEWTVLSLARGEYYPQNHTYFEEYYQRIISIVEEKATAVTLQNGALHKSKSTDNSRLILALSAIGKDASCVGNWNLIAPYEDFQWIKKQGLNGVIFALLALDSKDYQTTDTTIRQQCIDNILERQLSDGGWALSGSVSDPDVTAMALQSLFPYREQTAVAKASQKAFDCLSAIQNPDGGYTSFGDANSESCAQVIVAATTWGINPDTDQRFIKNNTSVIDALLAHYVEKEAAFKHAMAGTVNAMATDQACYALVGYDRFLKGKTSIYDMSDVSKNTTEEVVSQKLSAILGLPAQITDEAGQIFHGTISLNQWDDTKEYKLIDFIMDIPEGIKVTDVTVGNRIQGGTVSYHLDEAGKLRVVYFDASENGTITVTGTEFPAQFFDIAFQVENIKQKDQLNVSIGGMSLKRSSNPEDETAMVIVDTAQTTGSIEIVEGISYSAVCLYTGDDIDIIPSSQKAVCVSVTGISKGKKLVYKDDTHEYELQYSPEVTQKTGVSSYVALVDASIEMNQFANKKNFTISKDTSSEITFGDANGDGVVNAQDALAAVDTWLRKTEEPDNQKILALNVNSDSRINTFDALGIAEAFVNNSEYLIVTKAAMWQ